MHGSWWTICWLSQILPLSLTEVCDVQPNRVNLQLPLARSGKSAAVRRVQDGFQK